MLIAVISDTHRSSYDIDKAIDLAKDADVLIHLGDVLQDIDRIKSKFKKRIVCVAGNCDYNSFEKRENILELEGIRVLLCHGDRYRVDMGLVSLKYRAQEVGASIALFGHTHRSLVINEDNILFMNPGSTSMPRDGKKSMGFIEIKEEKIDGFIKEI